MFFYNRPQKYIAILLGINRSNIGDEFPFAESLFNIEVNERAGDDIVKEIVLEIRNREEKNRVLNQKS